MPRRACLVLNSSSRDYASPTLRVSASNCCPKRHQPKQSPSTSVGARVVRSGGEGLYGRPRPVPFAHRWRDAITPPPPGDHKGPPFPASSALAPTDHPACCLASRLSLMRMGCHEGKLNSDTQAEYI